MEAPKRELSEEQIQRTIEVFAQMKAEISDELGRELSDKDLFGLFATTLMYDGI